MKKNFILFILFIMFGSGCDSLRQGSYVYAERYELSYSKERVIAAVKVFKQEHPDMCPPDSSLKVDGHGDSSPFYYIYFYYPDTHVYVNTWVRSEGNNCSTFALYAVRASLAVPARSVNDEMSSEESDAIKAEFERRILNPIKETLRR